VRVQRVVAFCIVSLTVVSSVLAQSPNGTINGRILDPSGAAIVGAEVMIVNDATRVQYASKTNGDGIYVVTNLPPGPYRLQVAKPGFKTLIKPDIVLNVQDSVAINFTLPIGAVADTVTIEGGAPLVDTQSATVSTVIDRNFVESLPLNGRSFNTLLQLTPGVVIAPVASGSAGGDGHGQFSIAGQRPDANTFTVDGVSANFGVSSDGIYSGSSGTGSAQAFSALGGTSSLVSVEALQEFRVETSSFAPEFGKTPGGQVILTTRSGTNDLHGGVYEYFRNNVMDANDWFANQAGNPRAPERHNDFGGFLGGPIRKGKTFFFFSYEGARLRLPQSAVTIVPSLDARKSAPATVAPYLNAFPMPNGPAAADDFTAKFTGTYSNEATLNATGLRIDHTISDRFSIFGRYNYAPSETVSRDPGLSLNRLASGPVNTQTLTVGVNMLITKAVANTIRGNYSVQTANFVSSLDSFGGGVPLNPSLLLGSLSKSDNFGSLNIFDTGEYAVGPEAKNQTRQLDFADDLSMGFGVHQLKIGGDFRSIFLDKNPYNHGVALDSPSVQDLVSTGTVELLFGVTRAPTNLVARTTSLYGQDTWKLGSRLSLTYGLRWELAPAPSPRNNTRLASWINVNDPPKLALSPFGTPLWDTTYGNFAPRIGIAYGLTDKGDFVIRGGWGMFYDSGIGAAADVASFFPGGASKFTFGVPLPVTNVNSYLPSISTQPPYPFVLAFSPDLKLPHSYQWNVALEKSFEGRQVITVTYVGQEGSNLLRETALFQPNAAFNSEFLLTANTAYSNYNALQVQYRKPLSTHLQALLNYTWSHSLDNASSDVVAGLSNTVLSAANDYASSGFDVRHSFSGALTLTFPTVAKSTVLEMVTKGWSLSSVIVARTGFPFNARVQSLSPDLGGTAESRPDIVQGQPFWITNTNAAGGKSLNPNAFVIPMTPRQGTEGRNDIPGFGLTQVDLSLGRKFAVTERINVRFQADAFNALNHPNFANPAGLPEVGPTSLESAQMLNNGLGGLNPLFQEGGPRSLQLSLKLIF